MKVIDFHPDDLLDLEIEGTLSPEEKRRLGEHLESCMECQLERQLR
jgi:anti-sigma factor RsiW